MTDNDPLPAAPHEPPAPVIDHEPPAIDPPMEPVRPGTGRPVRPAARRGIGWLFAILVSLLLFGFVEAQSYGYLTEYGVPPAVPQNDGQGLAALRQQVQGLAQAQAQMQAAEQTAGQAAGAMQTLTQQVQALTDRVGQLEKTPSAASPGQPGTADMGDLPKRVDDLSARVATLESQPAAAPAAGPSDTGDRQAIAALGQKLDRAQAADKAAIDQAQGQAQADIQSQLQAGQKRLLEEAQAASLAQQQAILVQEKAALDQLASRIDKLEQGAGGVEDAASRATRLERVQAAIVALQSGASLGAIPDAPPALAKFATQPPPTEAALRESFPGLAAHARDVSQPDTAHRSFLQRAFARLQESVTVRQGDAVLVGDPAAGLLADAEVKVQNGDLAGAVQRLQALHGPAASVMAPWVGSAQSLIAARAALAALAARG